MAEGLLLCSFASSFVAGTMAGRGLHDWWGAQRRRQALLRAVGAGSVLDATGIVLESEGIDALVLGMAIKESLYGREGLRGVKGAQRGWSRALGDAVVKAGLEDSLTPIGVFRSRLRCALAGALGLGVAGWVFSPLLALICSIAGGVAGWSSVPRALRREVNARSESAERQLSQMVEVIVLGLQSGMSFDRSLSLYHQRFEGSLSRALASAQGQWTHGLVDRSEGLRRVARSYDSLLFDRLAENAIRSVRFGTSLAEGLSVVAAEARAVRKAKLEERVAKAPVKMLLPVGGLILPAMLLFDPRADHARADVRVLIRERRAS